MDETTGVSWHTREVKREQLGARDRHLGPLTEAPDAVIARMVKRSEAELRRKIQEFVTSDDFVLDPHFPLEIVWECRVNTFAYRRPDDMDREEFSRLLERANSPSVLRYASGG